MRLIFEILREEDIIFKADELCDWWDKLLVFDGISELIPVNLSLAV